MRERAANLEVNCVHEICAVPDLTDAVLSLFDLLQVSSFQVVCFFSWRKLVKLLWCRKSSCFSLQKSGLNDWGFPAITGLGWNFGAKFVAMDPDLWKIENWFFKTSVCENCSRFHKKLITKCSLTVNRGALTRVRHTQTDRKMIRKFWKFLLWCDLAQFSEW